MDVYDQMKASACNRADVCLMAADCPFVADCRAVEGVPDDAA